MFEARIPKTEDILKKLNKKLGKVNGLSLEGLLASGLIVQGSAQKKVPVEYGNLRASAYTRKGTTGAEKTLAFGKTVYVTVGFGAAYALFVHENYEQKLKGQERPSGLGVYWGPSGEPGYLTKALRENEQRILETVAAYGAQGLK